MQRLAETKAQFMLHKLKAKGNKTAGFLGLGFCLTARAGHARGTGLQLWALPAPRLVTRSHASQSTNKSYKPLMTLYVPQHLRGS